MIFFAGQRLPRRLGCPGRLDRLGWRLAASAATTGAPTTGTAGATGPRPVDLGHHLGRFRILGPPTAGSAGRLPAAGLAAVEPPVVRAVAGPAAGPASGPAGSTTVRHGADATVQHMDSERDDTGADDEPDAGADTGSDTGGRPPSFGRVSLTLLANQTHVNLLGNVHGGEVMRLVDSTAGAAAGRHSGGPAVTAAMDEMAFLAPVKVGDILRATAQVNWAGRTSMEVGVRVDSEPWNQAGTEPVHVASAYLVFVAIDEEGKPREIPSLEPDQRQGGTPHARGRDPALAPARPQGRDRRGPLPLSAGR